MSAPVNLPPTTSASTTVAPQADLSVSLAPLGPAVPGHDVYLSAVVSNAGPDAATEVVVDVTLPPSLAFQEATPATWQCAPGAGTTVTCRFPSLAASTSSTVVLRTALAAGRKRFRTTALPLGPLAVSATVRSSTGDAAAASNTTSVEVVPMPVGGFAALYAAVDNGEVLVAGNSLMHCDPNTDCAGVSNNSVTMVATGADGVVTASSAANLVLPADAEVVRAWLLWGAKDLATLQSGTAAYDGIRLTTPGGATWTPPTTPTVVGLNGGLYGEADVTGVVTAAGAGTYTFASLGGYTGRGTDLAGGWSLVVVTHQASAPERVMVVMDGLVTYSGNDLSIPLGGLGPVPVAGRTARVGMVAWDGDRGAGSDHMDLDVGGVTVPVWDAVHPVDDVMTSRVAVGGVPTADIAANTLGFDASLIDVALDGSAPPPAPGSLAPVGPPSGSITLKLSATEAVWLGALTLSVPT